MPRTTGDCANTVPPAAAAASTVMSVSGSLIGTSLNRGPSGDRAVREFPAVGKRDLFEQRRRLPIPERRHNHGDPIARLDHVELPPGAIEDAGARTLDQPVALLTRLLVRGVDLDVDVGVDPLELGDDARQLYLQRALVRRKRVMRADGPSREDAECQQRRKDFHGAECISFAGWWLVVGGWWLVAEGGSMRTRPVAVLVIIASTIAV